MKERGMRSIWLEKWKFRSERMTQADANGVHLGIEIEEHLPDDEATARVRPNQHFFPVRKKYLVHQNPFKHFYPVNSLRRSPATCNPAQSDFFSGILVRFDFQ
jgi:hypothetical protein